MGCENSITLLTWEFTGRLATPQWALPRLGECVLRLVQRMGFAAELEDATRPRTRRCRTAGQGRGRVLTPHREHAYYLQYENRKAEWVDAFWNLVDWYDVAGRFDKARHIDLALGV